MRYQFSSNLKNFIIGFLAEKRSLGYSYQSGESILKQFDRFCIECYPDVDTVTSELGLSWSVRRKDEKGSSFEGRVCIIRELARYMKRCGTDAFVIPKGMGCGGSRFVPHIFTDEELVCFFEKLDKMKVNAASPLQHIVYPVLFRLLYSTGLRPSEAVNLSCQNVDLKNGVLFIEQSKGNKDRIVVLSDDMLELMRKYWYRASEIVPINLYFFPDSQGGCIRTTTLNKMFKKYWEEADLGNPEKKTPRVYDFRHTFATRSLFNQIGKEIDINAFLPYLSAYMGHNHLSDTAYYIHLNPGFFPNAGFYERNDFDNLLPEVDYER
mgnify:CR=1 FL=1